MRSYKVSRTDDEAVNRNLNGIAAALEDLGNLPDALGLAGEPSVIIEVGKTLDKETVAIYRGAVAATLTLPGAMTLGNNISRSVWIFNDSGAAVTVAVADGETLSGSTAVATTVKALFKSDGVSRWYRVI